MSREMKHSGIAWLGKIPNCWNVLRLKNLGFLYGGLTGKSGDDFVINEDEPCSYIYFIPFTNIFNNDVIDTKQLYKVKTEEGEQQNLVNKFDILFLMSSEDNDGVGKPAIIEEQVDNLGLNSFCKGLRITSNQIYPKFLYYLLSSHIIRELIRQEARGFIRINLRQDKLSCCPIFLPPLAEQKAIADFLDKKCGEIDELVALQEKIIEELKAYKQSVITEAVCKGLNPNVPMKDSGVEWIGDIPEAWSIVKLGLLTSKIGSGSTPSGGAEVYTEEGVKFMRSQNVYFEGFDLTNVAHISQEIDEQMKSTRVYKGDILFNITGGSIGRCCDVDATLGAANVNQHVCIVRPTKILTKYLKYYLQSNSGQIQVRLLQTGGNRDGLSADAFKKFLILVPTCSEQEEIADYLDKKCSEIDQLISIKQQKIVELKDYKKSLIYEYTTGKKEVKL